MFRTDNKQLFYSKLIEHSSQDKQLENNYTNIYANFENSYENGFDLNYGYMNMQEQWRIDELTRDKSDKILKNYREAFKTGTFLIRKSERDKDYLTLCFLYEYFEFIKFKFE